ncbi:hypothetical protein CR513_46372, partial [Mucuna pruriens]
MKLFPTSARLRDQVQSSGSTEEARSDDAHDTESSNKFYQRRRGIHLVEATSSKQRQLEAEERHRQGEEQHLEVIKATEQRKEELRRQIAVMKVVAEKPGGGVVLTAYAQAFWGQLFGEEIDEISIPTNFREVVDPHTHLQAFQAQMYISGGNNPFSCKLFPVTLQVVVMHWLAILLFRSIRSFNDLATSFISQFATNRIKRLEVADLFDIRKAKGEILNSYLARFNNATVWVINPDQKFFVKAFQKVLRINQFSDSLVLRRS